jgi:hypothetical protein
MRKLGMILMGLGFLIAAFVSTRQADTVAWGPYALAALVGAAGVVLLRKTAGERATRAETVRANLATLEGSLARVVERVAALLGERTRLSAYDVHGRIDADLVVDLAAFADARESMIHGIGLQEYANVMDHFARGERLVNRAWSASADGYGDEVWSCLRSAESEFREADGVLRHHMAGRTR